MGKQFNMEDAQYLAEGYADGDTPAELAEELGVSESTVRRTIKRYLESQEAEG